MPAYPRKRPPVKPLAFALVLTLAVSACSRMPAEQSAPPSSTSESGAMTTSTWNQQVPWPDGASISVAAPRHQQTDGTTNPAWTEVVVTVTNGAGSAYRASSLRVETTSNDRMIKPVIPDIAGLSLTDKTIAPQERFSFSLVFATGTLGKDLTIRLSSTDERVRPTTTFTGEVSP